MHQIILASQSPRRKQLLEWAEVEFDVVAKETDETYPPDLPVVEIPVFIARRKAWAVRSELGNENIIIAADTVVVLDNEIIGKPKDFADAVNILTRLSGRKHVVITGVVIEQNKKEIAFSESTEVKFYALSKQQIEFYVEKYRPFDKAGAYAIQEWIGVIGIEYISGDFYNVMGLPVSRVVQVLHSLTNKYEKGDNTVA